jgi:hypothetical protein
MYTCLDDVLKNFQSAFCRLPELYSGRQIYLFEPKKMKCCSDAKIEYEFQGETFSHAM